MIKGKTTRGRVITEIMTYFGLIAAMLVVLFPFYVAIITSVKDVLEVRGPFTWWPHTFTTTAYKLMFDANELDINYLRALINTLTIAVPIVLFGCLSSSMSAYIFAKQEFLGKNMMFALMMTSMMVPSVVTLIPSYLIFTALGWVDTFLPLVVPGMFGSISVLFALRQFMCGIPNALTDAAKIDGLGYFGTYVAIILPLSYPPIIAQAIMMFMGVYNDYMGPLLYLLSPELETLQLSIVRLQDALRYYPEKTQVSMAFAVVMMVPLLFLYIVAQKFLAKGVMAGAVKG